MVIVEDSIESYCKSFGNIYASVLKDSISNNSGNNVAQVDAKSNLDGEIFERINAQIHALLLNNMSSETGAKYRYNVEIGNGSLLWKLLCESNELNTRQLQLLIRQEIFNAKILNNVEPWLGLRQFIDNLNKNICRLRMISQDQVNDFDLLALLENAIKNNEVYRDLRSWIKLSEPNSFVIYCYISLYLT